MVWNGSKDQSTLYSSSSRYSSSGSSSGGEGGPVGIDRERKTPREREEREKPEIQRNESTASELTERERHSQSTQCGDVAQLGRDAACGRASEEQACEQL